MSKEDERVLVLPAEVAVPQEWLGIKTEGLDGFESTVRKNGQFRRRGDVETDPNWKQVIPYLVFNHQDRYFLMQRTTAGGEERLHNKFSLGIGGHVNEPDLDGAEISDWAKREFEEEVEYSGGYTTTPIGLIYEPTSLVGQVHLGYVLLLKGDSSDISIRETDVLTGMLATIPEIRAKYDQLEGWSKFVFEELSND